MAQTTTAEQAREVAKDAGKTIKANAEKIGKLPENIGKFVGDLPNQVEKLIDDLKGRKAQLERDLIQNGKLEERLAPKLAGLLAGPKAEQRVEKVFAIKRALDKGTPEGRTEALRLVRDQAFLELDRALDQFKPCDVGGLPAEALRLRATVKGAQACRNSPRRLRTGIGRRPWLLLGKLRID